MYRHYYCECGIEHNSYISWFKFKPCLNHNICCEYDFDDVLCSARHRIHSSDNLCVYGSSLYGLILLESVSISNIFNVEKLIINYKSNIGNEIKQAVIAAANNLEFL